MNLAFLRNYYFQAIILLSLASSCGLFEDDTTIPESESKKDKVATVACPRSDAAKGYALNKKYPELCFFEICQDQSAPGFDEKKNNELQTFLKSYRAKLPEKFRAWNFVWHDPNTCKYESAMLDHCQHPIGHDCSDTDKEKCTQKLHCEFFLCENEMTLENERFREFEQHIKRTGGGKISKRADKCGSHEVVVKIKPAQPTEPLIEPPAATTGASAEIQVADLNTEIKDTATPPTPTIPTIAPTAIAAPPEKAAEVTTAPAPVIPSNEVNNEVKVEFTSEVVKHEETLAARNVTATSVAPMKVCLPPTLLNDFTTNISNMADFEESKKQDNCGCQFKLCMNPKYREYSELLVEEVKKYEARCKAKFPMDELSVLTHNQCMNEEIAIEKNISPIPMTMHLIVDNSSELSPWQTVKKVLLEQIDGLMEVGVNLKLYALSQVNQNYEGAPQLLAPICEKKRFSVPSAVAELNINSQNSKDQVINLLAESFQRIPAVANFFYPAGLCYTNRLFDHFEQTTKNNKAITSGVNLVFLATHRDDYTNNVNAVNETYCFDSVAPKQRLNEQNTLAREVATNAKHSYYAKVRALEFTATIDGVETKTFTHSLDDEAQTFYESLASSERECRSNEMFWLKQKEKISDNFKSCRIKKSFNKILISSSEVAEPNLCLFTCDQRPSFYLGGEGHDCVKELAKQKIPGLTDFRYVTCEHDSVGAEVARSTPLCAANPLVGNYEMLPANEQYLKQNPMIKDNWKFILFNSLSDECLAKGLKKSKHYQEKMQGWKNQLGADVRSVDLCADSAAANLSQSLVQLMQDSTQGINYYIQMPPSTKIEKITLMADNQKLVVAPEHYKILPPEGSRGHRLQFTPLSFKKTVAGFQKIIVTYAPAQ